MKTFLVLFKHKNKGNLSEILLKEHVAYLESLYQKVLLPFCGPFLDNEGALWILKAENYENAKDLIQRDPFIQKNYYQSFEIKEFYHANPDNDWLMHHDQTKGNIKS